jgi:hypothetical protein
MALAWPPTVPQPVSGPGQPPLQLTLITNNLREFERVHGLRCENWVNP